MNDNNLANNKLLFENITVKKDRLAQNVKTD